MSFRSTLLTSLALSAIATLLRAADPAGSSVSPAPASHSAPPTPAGTATTPDTGAAKTSPSIAALSLNTPAVAAQSRAPLPEDDPVQAEIASRATPLLKKLTARQDALLALLGRDDADQENVKRDIQTLIFDYDNFLRTFPTYVPGYVTYGLLFGKIGMRRESAAILLKANEFNPDIPIVKNQLGNYLAEEGEPVEASNYFLAAIRLAPEEPLYHYQLGTLLAEARDDFLKSGQWTRAQLDRTMQEAFKRAAELAPKNFAFAYRYAQSFYDLAEPKWDEALKVWGDLEDQVSPGLEKETLRLHAVNILIKQKKFDHARLLLATVTAEPLSAQKQKLLDQLPANTEK
jgi:tetratricopeptide (TPR) repeat protein